ncbi:hypothetical protein BpHYR1_045524 [Brachionus plicatilis]|uniref:Uncharacterized protein n=1 Tax=Brachionus plicatilis TaxID=10195 RepID=A0A3M7SG82_BRAPC|nr:hypothetical protein BpHYR1_045524 [Brachionus plicatilis]
MSAVRSLNVINCLSKSAFNLLLINQLNGQKSIISIANRLLLILFLRYIYSGTTILYFSYSKTSLRRWPTRRSPMLFFLSLKVQ